MSLFVEPSTALEHAPVSLAENEPSPRSSLAGFNIRKRPLGRSQRPKNIMRMSQEKQMTRELARPLSERKPSPPNRARQANERDDGALHSMGVELLQQGKNKAIKSTKPSTQS
jgi:hypothetical protein